jgi:glutaredoxin
MSFLDKVGKLAMDGLDKATRVVDKVQERVDPLIARSALATKVRDRIAPNSASGDEPPDPYPNVSPFIDAPQEEEETPLGNPELAGQVFGNGTDPWTGRVLQMLTDHETDHEFIDLESEGGLKLETRLVRETQQDKPPYVFLRGELIGGYNALNEIVRLGQLEVMTTHPDERSKGSGGVRIVIAKREGDDLPPGERS